MEVDSHAIIHFFYAHGIQMVFVSGNWRLPGARVGEDGSSLLDFIFSYDLVYGGVRLLAI